MDKQLNFPRCFSLLKLQTGPQYCLLIYFERNMLAFLLESISICYGALRHYFENTSRKKRRFANSGASALAGV